MKDSDSAEKAKKAYVPNTSDTLVLYRRRHLNCSEFVDGPAPTKLPSSPKAWTWPGLGLTTGGRHRWEQMLR